MWGHEVMWLKPQPDDTKNSSWQQALERIDHVKLLTHYPLLDKDECNSPKTRVKAAKTTHNRKFAFSGLSMASIKPSFVLTTASK